MSNVLKAYRFYKSLYANNMILFRIMRFFEAYEDDAIFLASFLQLSDVSYDIDAKIFRFDAERLDEVLRALKESDVPVTIVSYRNTNGIFMVNKVKQKSV